MKNSYIYLATPYSHPLKYVREYRFNTACKIAAQLMSKGAVVFSPIAHTHPICEVGDFDYSYSFWKTYDEVMLLNAAKLLVVLMPGWTESKGVQEEIKFATRHNIPVQFMEWEDVREILKEDKNEFDERPNSTNSDRSSS
jgi:hypothetical protein